MLRFAFPGGLRTSGSWLVSLLANARRAHEAQLEAGVLEGVLVGYEQELVHGAELGVSRGHELCPGTLNRDEPKPVRPGNLADEHALKVTPPADARPPEVLLAV